MFKKFFELTSSIIVFNEYYYYSDTPILAVFGTLFLPVCVVIDLVVLPFNLINMLMVYYRDKNHE